MSTLVNVGSVVCDPGTTTTALQSLSWREIDDIVFFVVCAPNGYVLRSAFYESAAADYFECFC
jgi:hypothetical protein